MNDTRKKTRIIVAISGGGRSLENLWDDAHKDDVYEIVGVICSSSTCKGLALAKSYGVEIFINNFKDQDKTLFDQLENWLSPLKADYILLAGFLKHFPDLISFQNKILNIHPALLPEFGGKGMYGHHVHAAVVDAKKKISGATVHYVNSSYDEGRIISQAEVNVHENDDAESLAHRVFQAEKKLYPQTLRDMIEGKLPLDKFKIKKYSWGST